MRHGVSRALTDDASRPALAGWCRPASSLRVNLLSTIFFCFVESRHTASAPSTSGTHTGGVQ